MGENMSILENEFGNLIFRTVPFAMGVTSD